MLHSHLSLFAPHSHTCIPYPIIPIILYVHCFILYGYWYSFNKWPSSYLDLRLDITWRRRHSDTFAQFRLSEEDSLEEIHFIFIFDWLK